MRPASQILKLRQWVQETSGFDGWWECFQLDRAVSWFGRYVENKLSKLDKTGHPIYRLEELLSIDDKADLKQTLAALGAALGTINNR